MKGYVIKAIVRIIMAVIFTVAMFMSAWGDNICWCVCWGFMLVSINLANISDLIACHYILAKQVNNR